MDTKEQVSFDKQNETIYATQQDTKFGKDFNLRVLESKYAKEREENIIASDIGFDEWLKMKGIKLPEKYIETMDWEAGIPEGASRQAVEEYYEELYLQQDLEEDNLTTV